MKLNIKFFATLRDRAGIDHTVLELAESATVEALVAALSARFPALEEALPSALIAVNHEYAFRDTPLQEGDEIALFPPVSGGVDEPRWPEYFAVTNDQLDVDAIIQTITVPETGAVAVFAGAVRGVTHKPGVPEITSHLFYEAYEPMAEKMLRQVAAEIRDQYPKVQGIAVVQRLGHLKIGETTILVACSSGHRNDGIFEAAHYGINRVKEIVPVWKKEVGPAGEIWIEGDYHPTPTDVTADRSAPTKAFEIGCASCGETYEFDTDRFLCKCGEPLDVISAPPFDPSKVDASNASMWRYQAMLIPSSVESISMGEGWTPLTEIDSGGLRLFAKMESLNPSGSFKDRGASLLVSLLHSRDITNVHDDSSGNAGAALAAYAARAKINATLFVPSLASPTKLAQIELYGADLRPIDGARSECTEAAMRYASEGKSFYASHVLYPMPMLAYKSIAWEIWEQLDHRAPDHVIVPIGQGSQLIGIFRGFQDLYDANVIDKLPSMIGVQATACAPIWLRHKGNGAVSREDETLAEGIRVANPRRSEAVSEAVSLSGGDIVTVTEAEIIEGIAHLASLGLFVEPTSAVVWGALKKVESSFSKDDTIVLVLTGSGLKSSNLEQMTHLVKSRSTKAT